MQRKDIKIPTLKKLFALSGNICAFPGCNEKIVDDNEVVMGVICHIEAAKKGGPRYSEKSDDEKRRSLDNLILLCPNHHRRIDIDPSYTGDSLKKMKLELVGNGQEILQLMIIFRLCIPHSTNLEEF